MRITRRGLLAITIGIQPATRGAMTPARHPRPRPEPLTHAQGAEFIAGWELVAIKDNFPAWWQRLNYTGLICWAPGIGVLYGVGSPDQADEDYTGAGRWLATLARAGRAQQLAESRSPCRRSWAIVADGIAPQHLRANIRWTEWRRACARALLGFEHRAGRQRPRTFHV